ncbi:MAG: NADPH:quinone reductase [Thermoguttaceae bacterium]
MKAAYIERTGPPENIIYGDLPQPEPEGAQVLVRVGAAAVNPVDTYVRSGMTEFELPMPFIVGCDLAGKVVDVGPDVTRFKVGDRVWGTNQGLLGRQGACAEYAAVDQCWLYPTPENISNEEAAAVALVGITAHLGTFHHANLQSRETVFVSGGTGGVGSCVVQMSRAIGARVITTAGSVEKLKSCLAMGASKAINYKTSDLDAAIRKFAPDGVDLWWGTLREYDLHQAVSHLALGGRIVIMAGRESTPELPIEPFYLKNCSILGFAMFNATAEEQRKCAAEINRWMGLGRLRANIDRVMPLYDAAAAHKLQEDNTLHNAGTLAGKIILTP